MPRGIPRSKADVDKEIEKKVNQQLGIEPMTKEELNAQAKKSEGVRSPLTDLPIRAAEGEVVQDELGRNRTQVGVRTLVVGHNTTLQHFRRRPANRAGWVEVETEHELIIHQEHKNLIGYDPETRLAKLVNPNLIEELEADKKG